MIKIQELNCHQVTSIESISPQSMEKIFGGERSEQIFDDGSRLITNTVETDCGFSTFYIVYDSEGSFGGMTDYLNGIYDGPGCLDNIA
jgi:hypothetical protein